MSQQQYDNNRRGALWHAERTTDKSPHFTGDIMLDGKKWRLRMFETDNFNDGPGRMPAYRVYAQPWEEWEAEVAARKAARGQGGGQQQRTRPAQVDRPKERGLPLDQNMIDDDLPW